MCATNNCDNNSIQKKKFTLRVSLERKFKIELYTIDNYICFLSERKDRVTNKIRIQKSVGKVK